MAHVITHGPEQTDHCHNHPEIPILFEDNHLLVVQKPKGMLSQEDRTGDHDLLRLCKEHLKIRYNKTGNAFLGLVHRLDRPVGGIMVLAKTSKAAARLSEQIRNREFRKEYLLVCRGEAPPNGWLTDHIKKDSSANKARVVTETTEGAQRAELSFVRSVYNARQDLSLVRVNLITGRPHQIRIQFAAAGYPLVGDRKYGSAGHWSFTTAAHEDPALFASALEFLHPISNERVRFIANPPNRAPWRLFQTN